MRSRLPKKSKGAPPKLNSMQVNELEALVRSSRETSNMSYLEFASNFFEWNVGEKANRITLTKRGYLWYLARSKPLKLEENSRIRKAWAEAHLDLTSEGWSLIFLSDETWINEGKIKS